MKNKILVTGGSGFLGRNLVKKLSLDKNNHITILDNNSRASAINEIIQSKHKNIKYIRGSILDYNTVKKACTNIDTIFHLAYINGTKFFYSIPDKIFEVATMGMINLIKASKNKKIKNFILASSSEVYQNPSIIPTPENIELKIPDINNPRYSYGGGKIFSEMMLFYYGKKFFKNSIIFRPHNVYGPNMGNEHVIPEFIKKIKNAQKKGNKTISLEGKGSETRSFIYINDFIDALNILFKKGKDNNIYNIGTTEEVTILNLLQLIQKKMNTNFKIKHVPIKKGGTNKRCPDINKIKKLGFKKKYSLSTGLDHTIDWYKRN